MQRSKRGNPHRSPRKRKSAYQPVARPLARVRLTLHEVDPLTGNEDTIYSLFYEFYRGYTIYSNEQGRCCIHGPRGGSLRILGRYVCFPDVEEAKSMIKHFLADGHTAQECMDRPVPEDAYIYLNGMRQRNESKTNRTQWPISA